MTDEDGSNTYECMGGPWDGRVVALSPGVWQLEVVIPAVAPMLAQQPVPDSIEVRRGLYVVSRHVDFGPMLRWMGEQ